MSEVPAGWSEVTLEDVCCFYAGYGFPTAMQGRKGQELPFYKVRDVSIAWNAKSKFLLETENSLSMIEATSIRAKPLPTGSVVFAKIGEALRLNRRAVTSAPSLIDNNMMGMWAPPELVDPRFLYWYSTATRFDSDARASVVPSIRKSDVAGLKFHLPPRHEQTRIVEKLEELLSDLDAGVAELKAAQKKLALYRQSLLKAAVEGALTADWRARRAARGESLETGADLLARILTERRARWEARQLAQFKEQGKTPPKGWEAKYPEPKLPSTIGLPPLPEGWAWASVAQLGEVQLGRQRSPTKLSGRCATKYIRAANITESGINFDDVLEMDFNDAERETFALKQGDVLLTEASGSPEHVGRPVIWPGSDDLYCFQNTVIRFTPIGLRPEFAFHLFLAWQKTGIFSRLSGGVGINHLSAGKFSSMSIPLPPLDEQMAVVDKLAVELSAMATQHHTIEHSLRQATAQRKNLLKAAFSGQLVPQDPNDEPASALLARIRAERAASGHNTRRQRQKQETP